VKERRNVSKRKKQKNTSFMDKIFAGLLDGNNINPIQTKYS
jgi:hypothetical protein